MHSENQEYTAFSFFLDFFSLKLCKGQSLFRISLITQVFAAWLSKPIYYQWLLHSSVANHSTRNPSSEWGLFQNAGLVPVCIVSFVWSFSGLLARLFSSIFLRWVWRMRSCTCLIHQHILHEVSQTINVKLLKERWRKLNCCSFCRSEFKFSPRDPWMSSNRLVLIQMTLFVALRNILKPWLNIWSILLSTGDYRWALRGWTKVPGRLQSHSQLRIRNLTVAFGADGVPRSLHLFLLIIWGSMSLSGNNREGLGRCLYLQSHNHSTSLCYHPQRKWEKLHHL